MARDIRSIYSTHTKNRAHESTQGVKNVNWGRNVIICGLKQTVAAKSAAADLGDTRLYLFSPCKTDRCCKVRFCRLHLFRPLQIRLRDTLCNGWWRTCCTLFSTNPSVFSTFPIFYDVSYGRHTCDLKTPRNNRKGG